MASDRRSKLSYVRNTIRNEGSFDYTFRNYSHFEEVKDEKFHELRQAYLDAHEALRAYLDFDEDNGDFEEEDGE